MSKQMDILNTHTHRNLAMHPAAQTHPHCVQIVTAEAPLAATTCPLFMVKDSENGRFNLVALFGFQPGELLVEGAGKGRALFTPLELIRMGFFADGENIAIDLAHPRFAPGGTIPLFDDIGEPTAETRLIQRSLGMLVKGRKDTETFIAAMLDLRLIEPLDITLRFDDGQKVTLEGLYTISLDALSELGDSDALHLFRNGHLATALCIANSRHQISALARRRNDRLHA